MEGSSILVPVGTTATRPVLGAGESALRYNSDIGGLEEWTGMEWKNVSANISAVSLKGTDTEANILSKVGMVAEDLWIASDTLDGWVYDGSVWINIGPLQGPQGVQGIDGKSAYTVAVENGFVGNEAEWLLSLVGATGATGNGIYSVVKTGTVGLVDTYTVTMTSGDTTTFTVTNGLDGVDGLDVDHIAQTSGTGAAGTVDVYTVWGDVAETVNLGTFNVYNGADGTGIVNSVVAGANVIVDSTNPISPVVGLGANVTTQGNTFNGAEQLVKLGVDGKLPVLDGSNLTGIDGLPDQTGFAGKYLTTSGTVASWAEVAGGSEHYDQEAAPTSPNLGATWYKPSTGKSYQRVNDGTSDLWLEIGSAAVGVTQDYVDTAVGTRAATIHTHVKADVGLSNVDNTSDADKPVSTATAAALSGKQNTLVSGTNIKTINGASVLGSGDVTVGVTVNNTLTSTSTTEALSAAQGKVLQDGKIAATNYATSTVGGTVKARLNGTTAYFTINGTTA